MKYKLSDPLQKAKFLARASFLAEKEKDVDLTELRPTAKRSLSQNSCWHAWCALIAEIIGEHCVEAVERDVKRAVIGQQEVYDVFTGEVTHMDWHTHLMTEDQMSDLLTKTKQWAFATYGWALPSREDVGFDEMINQYGK